MNRRRTSLFELLTDPGVPAMFLLGTIVLAVLGNAVYDWLTVWFAVELVALGSLLMLGLIATGLWIWVRARRSRAPVEVEPARILKEGYPGLIIFVSERPDASERAAISHHLCSGALRQIWMIVSNEAREKALKLSAELREQPGGAVIQLTQLPLADAFELVSAYNALLDAFELAGSSVDRVIVDITAGTKFMSTGAVLACREYGVPMEYVRVPYEGGQPVTDAVPQIMKVDL